MGTSRVLIVHLLCFCSLVMANRRCVDNGEDEFICTQDVVLLRERIDGYAIDMGVTQRVDGTEEEKRQIREVLTRTTDYFVEEVLAMPEYEYIRDLW